MVASQPAIDLSILLLMTANAKTHFEIHRFETVETGDAAMTFSAIKFAKVDVRLVAKLDVIRHIKNPHPRYRHFVLVVLLFFHDLRML
jgi:hypothetical protein